MKESIVWKQQANKLLERLRLQTNQYDPEEPDERWDIEEQLHEIWLAHPDCLPFLFNLLHDKNQLVRSTAVLGLISLKNKKAIPVLIKLIYKDPEIGVKLIAIRALGAIGGHDACNTLLSLLKEYKDINLIPDILRALVNCPTPETISILIFMLDNSNITIRWAAVEILSKIDQPSSTDALINLLKKPITEEYKQTEIAYFTIAARALGSRHDPRIFNLLESLLKIISQ